MAVGLQQFDLKNVDMMFAVSQQNLNEGLAEYIAGLEATVTYGFDVDENDNLIPPADPKNPNISFSGTLVPPPVVNGSPICPIIDISGAGANNQAAFNLTFADGATYKNNQDNKQYVQGQGNQAGITWIVKFQVDLKKSQIEDQTNLPDWLKQQLSILNGDYGHVFDLQQVLLDLQSLSLTTTGTLHPPQNFNGYDWALLVQGMEQFLVSSGGDIFTTPPAVGYAVTHNGDTPSQPLPTFIPTDADFVIVPNKDTPDISVLIFVLMVNGNQMPTAPANEFSNTALISDPSTTPGVALVRSDLFTSFLHKEFQTSSIAGAVSQYITVEYGNDDFHFPTEALSPVPQLDPSKDLFTPTSQNKGQLVSFKMPTQSTSKCHQYFGAPNECYYAQTDSSLLIQYSSNNTQAIETFGYSAFVVSGTLSTVISFSSSSPSGSTTDWTSPQVNFEWHATYQIQPVNDSGGGGGGVSFVYLPPTQSSSTSSFESFFPSTYTDLSGSGDDWGTVRPSIQNLVTSCLAPICTALPTTFEQGVVTSIKSLGNFVFPGGGTFTFSDCGVNTAFALYTTIQYQNPN